MLKQTKMIKFMIVVLIAIPICLLITGIVQTFISNDLHHQLTKEEHIYEQTQTNKEKLEEAYNSEINE